MDSTKRHVGIVLGLAILLSGILVLNRWKTPTGSLPAPAKEGMPVTEEKREVGRAEFIASVFKDVKPPMWLGSILVKEPAEIPMDSFRRVLQWANETGTAPLAAYIGGEMALRQPTEKDITEAARNLVFTAVQVTDNFTVSNYLFQFGKKLIDRGMAMNPKNVPLRNALITYLSIYENQPMKFLPVLRETLALDSNNIETHYIHLGLLKKSGQLKKAIEKCQKLISLQPQNPAWLFEESDLYGMEGDSANAKVYLNLAIKARKKQIQ